MAGSFYHIVGADGCFTMECIDNMGDAHEALDECYKLIYELAGGDTRKVSAACRKLKIADPWEEGSGNKAMALGGEDALP